MDELEASSHANEASLAERLARAWLADAGETAHAPGARVRAALAAVLAAAAASRGAPLAETCEHWPRLLGAAWPLTGLPQEDLTLFVLTGLRSHEADAPVSAQDAEVALAVALNATPGLLAAARAR